MEHSVYLDKLAKQYSNLAINPRQAYLMPMFTKTGAWRYLNLAIKGNNQWAEAEKLCYEYLKYKQKAEAIKHKVVLGGTKYAMQGRSTSDASSARSFNRYHRQMTAISNEFYQLTGETIVSWLQGVEI